MEYTKNEKSDVDQCALLLLLVVDACSVCHIILYSVSVFVLCSVCSLIQYIIHYTERKSLGAYHDSDATEQWHDGRRMGTVLSAIGNMLDSTAECLH